MNSTENKITVYDGNCNLCKRVVTRFVKWKWLDEEKTKPYEELSAEQQSQIDIEQFRSEMAVIDSNGGPTLYGVEGFLCAVGKRFQFLHSIKKDGFLFPLAQFIYRLVAWNRYIIMRPVSIIKCDCEPPLNKFYRLSLVAVCILVSLIISMVIGIVTVHTIYSPDEKFWSAVSALALVSIGWVLQITHARILLRGEKFYDYLGHLGIVMLIGALVMIPGILLYWIPGNIVIIINAIISFLVMLYMHSKRTKGIGLGVFWTILWVISFYGPLVGWILYSLMHMI